jgi:hypothetical protein
VDRFIRTFLDWMRKNNLMSDSKTQKFLKSYNKTIQQRTGLSPSQMQGNKCLEVQYVIDSIIQQNKIEIPTSNYKLNANDKVRLIEPQKTRYNVSPYYYTITDISEKWITITAIDGSFKTVSRSQLIPIDMSTSKIKEAKSRGDTSSVLIIVILKYYPKMDSYKVKFDLLDDNYSYIDVIKSKELRTNKLHENSKIELEFFEESYLMSYRSTTVLLYLFLTLSLMLKYL